MSGEGNTREGRLEGQHLELCVPRPFPGDGIFQKLPPEDALTPCAVFNACHRTPQLARSPAPYLKLPEPGTRRTLPTYFHFILCYRPQTCFQYTFFLQRSPTGFLGHTSHHMPYSGHTFRWTPVLCHINIQIFSISFVLQEMGTLFWDPAHLSHTHKSSSFTLQTNP